MASFLLKFCGFLQRFYRKGFSSLSESGFIPTFGERNQYKSHAVRVLISFREWLHSYKDLIDTILVTLKRLFSSLSESGFIPTHAPFSFYIPRCNPSSHLFQRVASFLHVVVTPSVIEINNDVLISFREWLHSY